MLLAIDVGNTNMEFGLFHEEVLTYKFRLGTNREITSDEVGLFVSQFLMLHSIPRDSISDAIISSVVPQVMYSLTNAIRKYFGVRALVIGENVPVEVVNKYGNPKEVGVDRLVNALAVYRKFGAPAIVVDFGTATTFDAVDENGAYLGGAIFPGIKISMDALFLKTAKLPRIEITDPGSVIGNTTVSSMQAGLVYGYTGVIKNITGEMKKKLNNPIVVATGGLSNFFGDLNLFDHIDSNLTLEGIKMVYDDRKRTGSGSSEQVL